MGEGPATGAAPAEAPSTSAEAPVDGQPLRIEEVPTAGEGPAGGERPVGHLPSVIGARGVAAALVFVAHMLPVFPDRKFFSAMPDWLGSLIEAPGGVGILYFFVLSGFLLTWNWRPARSIATYARIRVARIYPPHVAMWLYVVIASLFVWDRRLDDVAILVANLLLLQAWVPHTDWQLSVNGPTWTLSNEVFMYAVLPLLVVGTTVKVGRAIVAGALSLAVISVGFSGVVPVENLLTWPPAAILPLVVGVLSAHVMLTRPDVDWRGRRQTRLAVAAGAVALAAVVVIAAAGGLTGIGVPAVTVFWLAGIVLGGISVTRLVHHDVRGTRNRLVHTKVAQVLGDYSFPIYLTHIVALDTVLYAFGEHPRTRDGALVVCLLTAAVTALLSVAVHRLVERPAYGWITGRRLVAATAPVGRWRLGRKVPSSNGTGASAPSSR